MTTIVAYRLKGEDHTATLVAKQGLFWLVTNEEKGEHKIPAKAVEETWEEGAEPQSPAAQDTTPEPAAEDTPPAPTTPSLAAQLADGPKLAEPKAKISLQDLATDQGFEPRIARRQLRAAVAAGALEHNKSEGWEFDNNPETIEKIMKIITTKKRG